MCIYSSLGPQYYPVVRCLPYIPVRITRSSNTKLSGGSVKRKRKDREIDTVGSKPCGPHCQTIVVELLFLAREEA